MESKWRENAVRYGLVGFWEGTFNNAGPPLLYARLLGGPYLICNRPEPLTTAQCYGFQIVSDERVDFVIRTFTTDGIHQHFPFGLPVEPDHPP